VCTLLEEEIELAGARVLDAGCGVGGTSIALQKRGADVTAADIRNERLDALRTSTSGIGVQEADLAALPFADGVFDAVVLQDVIEHVADPARVLTQLARVLRPGGTLYLSTPNRDALLNLLADPHFNLPLVSRLTREELRNVLRKKRPADADRPDIAELLGAARLDSLLTSAGLSWRYANRSAAAMMFRQPETVVWSSVHLSIVRVLVRTGLHIPLRTMVRDTPGFFNRWLNPTWYILARKEAS